MHESGVRKTVVFRQVSLCVNIIQPFQILILIFQNLLIRHWRKVGCLDISNVVNSNVSKYGK